MLACGTAEALSPGARSTKGASKQRRDLINSEIDNLKDLLPLPETVRQRLFQLQVMSLVCIYIRKDRYLPHVLGPKNGLNDTTWTFDFSKALKGFLIMVTRQGKLLYLSENAADYLGHSVEEILSQGDSLYDMVDNRDHAAVQAELLSGPPSLSLGYGTANDEKVFLCRMTLSRVARRQPQFQKFVIVRGRYLHPAEYYQALMNLSGHGPFLHPVFAALCTPLISPETAETLSTGNTTIFSSVHKMDMTIVSIDTIYFWLAYSGALKLELHRAFERANCLLPFFPSVLAAPKNAVSGKLFIDYRAEYHLGFSSDDLKDRSWYTLVHPNDLGQAAQKHKQITDEKETSVILLVRIQTLSGAWLWLHTVLSLREGIQDENVQQIITATYQMLGDIEAIMLQANAWMYHPMPPFRDRLYHVVRSRSEDFLGNLNVGELAQPWEVEYKPKRRYSKSRTMPKPPKGGSLSPLRRFRHSYSEESCMRDRETPLEYLQMQMGHLGGNVVCMGQPPLQTLNPPTPESPNSAANCHQRGVLVDDENLIKVEIPLYLQPGNCYYVPSVLTPDTSPANSSGSSNGGQNGQSSHHNRSAAANLLMNAHLQNIGHYAAMHQLYAMSSAHSSEQRHLHANGNFSALEATMPTTLPIATASNSSTAVLLPGDNASNNNSGGTSGKVGSGVPLSRPVHDTLPEIEPTSLEDYLRKVETQADDEDNLLDDDDDNNDLQLDKTGGSASSISGDSKQRTKQALLSLFGIKSDIHQDPSRQLSISVNAQQSHQNQRRQQQQPCFYVGASEEADYLEETIAYAPNGRASQGGAMLPIGGYHDETFYICANGAGTSSSDSTSEGSCGGSNSSDSPGMLGSDPTGVIRRSSKQYPLHSNGHDPMLQLSPASAKAMHASNDHFHMMAPLPVFTNSMLSGASSTAVGKHQAQQQSQLLNRVPSKAYVK